MCARAHTHTGTRACVCVCVYPTPHEPVRSPQGGLISSSFLDFHQQPLHTQRQSCPLANTDIDLSLLVLTLSLEDCS